MIEVKRKDKNGSMYHDCYLVFSLVQPFTPLLLEIGISTGYSVVGKCFFGRVRLLRIGLFPACQPHKQTRTLTGPRIRVSCPTCCREFMLSQGRIITPVSLFRFTS